MKQFLSRYHPRFARSLVFMLQSTEYSTSEYLAWFWRAESLATVERRTHLDFTAKAKLLLAFAAAIIFIQSVVFATLLLLGIDRPIYLAAALGWLVLSPIITAYLLPAVLWLGKITVQNRQERTLIARATVQLESHAGLRIGIAGSYGKTTFKELLNTILSQSKRVAATPGNMNTPIGISRFVRRLNGDEEVLIFELGEYYPGDIKHLSEFTKPQIGVITGINEAHLSKFKTLERTTATIFEIADYMGELPVYKNGDNELIKAHAKPDDPLLYTTAGVNGWRVSDIKITVEATQFTAHKGKHKVKAYSALLGRQQIGPLVAAIDIADRLGLIPEQIEAGIAATTAYEHRMQPRQLAGAWIIDDTYNGNSDGVRTGLEWLAEIKATRRIYVTPGLVEQGSKTAQVHEAIGRQIAEVADIVVLMQNSTTPHIQKGLEAAGFKGTLTISDDPVKFYTNLDQFVATGDVVLMQNDWTDNYA